MREQKLIVPVMRDRLAGATLETIEAFQARMVELLAEAQDAPTEAEYARFNAELAAAHANVLGGGEAVPPVEERLTEAQWRERMGQPTDAPAEPEPAPKATESLDNLQTVGPDGPVEAEPDWASMNYRQLVAAAKACGVDISDLGGPGAAQRIRERLTEARAPAAEEPAQAGKPYERPKRQ